jgi:hypothetical protein
MVRHKMLESAIKDGRADIIRRLLTEGLDPNTRVNGIPILFLAVREHWPDIVSLLVTSGADINITDKKGKTALMNSHSSVMIELLLRLGADPDIRDTLGNKASHYEPPPSHRRYSLQMSEKMFSQKRLLPSKPGRITANWMEICNTMGNVGVSDLKTLIYDNVDENSFHSVSQFFASSSFENVLGFFEYVQGLSKREICAGLAKYYTEVKPRFLVIEYIRGGSRPITEMARKSIQSKRKKASLYSLAYRKARQTDPEKFREYVSQLDLPNLYN